MGRRGLSRAVRQIVTLNLPNTSTKLCVIMCSRGPPKISSSRAKSRITLPERLRPFVDHKVSYDHGHFRVVPGWRLLPRWPAATSYQLVRIIWTHVFTAGWRWLESVTDEHGVSPEIAEIGLDDLNSKRSTMNVWHQSLMVRSSSNVTQHNDFINACTLSIIFITQTNW